ncbi:MAG: glycosyltransferase [Candidatus Kapaibacteriota bacterium]|jgi:glycosyltransferase involved in cell wall biosynthesis
MKIAYLSTFYPFRGGIAQFNASLFNSFKNDLNENINAYTFKRQYPDILFPGTTQYVTADDNAEIIDSKRVLDTVNPLSYYSTANEINNFEADLLLTKFWMPFFAPSLGKVARKLDKKTKKIAILDNVIPHEKRPFDIQLIKYFLNSYDGFVVMSNKVKDDLLSLKPNAKYIFQEHPLYNHFGKKLDVIESKKKTFGDRYEELKDKKLLLYFGFIRDYKGLDLLIESMSLLDDSYHLIIAGEVYGNFDKYSEQISNLEVGHKITQFVKYINDSEVQELFSASDVCVLPYKSATQSGIVGISYNFDLPVIATDVGGLNEMIVPHNTGFMVDNPNSNEIAEKIKVYFDKEMKVDFEQNIINYKSIANWKSLAKNIIKFSKELK